jgi:solute carrier family 41
MEADAHLPF